MNITGGGLHFDAGIDLFKLQKDATNASGIIAGISKNALSQTQAQLKAQSNDIQDFAKKAQLAITSYLSLTTATSFITDIARVRGEFQQLEISFATMLGSKVKADKLLAEATELAAKTPFSLKDVADGSKQLLAYGFAAENVTQDLRMLGDIAAGVGSDLNGLVYLYGTLKTSGRVTVIDLQQFAGRGVPIFEELSKQLGVATSQIREMVSEGKIGFPEVEKAFKTMTGTGGMFANLMEQTSKSITGQLSNLSDAWARMLNDIGKDSEGAFSDAISAASSLVENYESVIKAVEVLIATFGAYKAATIVATMVTNGYTIAETLRYQAMLLSERATKILNATMLKNPAVLFTAGIVALVSALYLFRKTTGEVVNAQQLLNAEMSKGNTRFAEQQAEIKNYVAVLQNQNIAESVRLEAYTKLKSIAPEIINQLSFQAAKTTDLTSATNAYIASLRQRINLETKQAAYAKSLEQEEQARQDFMKKAPALNKKPTLAQRQNESRSGAGEMSYTSIDRDREDAERARQTYEAATKARKKLEDSISVDAGKGSKEAINARIQALQAEQKYLDKTSLRYKEIEDEVNSLNKSLAGLNKTTATTTSIRNEAFLKAEIERLKGLREPLALASKEYKNLTKQIEALENELNPKQGSKSSSGENKLNQFLEERKNILQAIEDLKRDAKQSGLIKEATEVDRVNEKYDAAILKVTEYNNKVKEFNRKNKSNVQGIGLVDMNALNTARSEELRNVNLKEEAEKYKTVLEAQKKVFEQYEETKRKVGIDKANAMYADQLKGFSGYIDYLKEESAKLLPKITLGIANIGEIEKFKSVLKELGDANNSETEKKRKGLEDLLVFAATYEVKKKAINDYYNSLQFQADEALKKGLITNSDGVYNKIKVNRQNDLDDLENAIIRSSDLYRRLGADTIGFSRERLKQEVKDLEAELKKGSSLTPEMETAIKQRIEQLRNLLFATNRTTQNALKTADAFQASAQGIESIVSSLGGADDTLKRILTTIASMAGATAQAIRGVEDFKKAQGANDIAGMVSAGSGIFSAVIAVATTITRMIDERNNRQYEARQAELDFQVKILSGEQNVNQIYRERIRQQITLNKLRIEGLSAESNLLKEQQKQVTENFKKIFDAIQKEYFDIGGGFQQLIAQGFNFSTDTVTIARSFDEIEKLYLEGRLTGRAKELFETLQKLKQEGADIEKLLEENKKKAQETFTGTTADSILDSIVDGFKKGYRSAQDFASGFQEMMQQAMLNALKFKYLEGPIKDFYNQFAAAAESDGQLTDSEIADLQKKYEAIINTASTQFQQLQQIAGINTGASNMQNTLQGAYKSLSEETGQLLAGQFGGLRITAMEIQRIFNQALAVHQRIEANTAATVLRLEHGFERMEYYYKNGVKVI